MSGRLLLGDCRDAMRQLHTEGVRVQMCVTSPPYWGLRDYGHPDQLGLEATPEAYVTHLVEVFRLVRDLLAEDGTLWLNLGDSYAAERGGTHQPAETLAGGVAGTMPDGSRVNRGRKDGHSPSRMARAIGLKHKDLVGIPWRVAFALQADGWYLRQDIIWAKPNPMPESVTDRCTKSHEYLFLLSKRERYYFDAAAIAEPIVKGDAGSTYTNGKTGMNGMGRTQSAESRARKQDGHGRRHAGFNARWDASDGDTRITRNKRSVWTVATAPYAAAHFATFPPALVTPCILAGSRPGDTVLDPFLGSGTTGEVAQLLDRRWIGCELNPDYAPLIADRTAQPSLPFAAGASVEERAG